MKDFCIILMYLFTFLSILIKAQTTHEKFPTKIIKNYKSIDKINNDIGNIDSNLTQIGHFGWGPCLAVASKGNFVYAGNGSLIHILDMTNPSSPLLVNEVDHIGLVDDLVVRDNLLFSLNPLQIFDITDPVNPERLYLSDKWAGYELLLDSNFVYIPNYIVIYMIDISNIEEPTLAGEIYPSGFTTDVTKYRNYLYNTTEDALFIEIWNISDKANPIEAGRFGQANLKKDIIIDGHYLYVSSFAIWDIIKPSDPELVGQWDYFDIADAPDEIKIKDTLAYLALRNDGISVLNISDKTNPYEIENIPWIGYPSESLGPWQIDVKEEMIYSASQTGLWTVNINGTDSLSNLSFYNTGFYDYDIVVDDIYGYIAASGSGLIIFNYVDPVNPHFTSQLPTWGAALRIIKKNNLIILLTHRDLLFIDVTDKLIPTEIGKVPGSYFFSMTVTDTLVICGSDSNNIRIINYSDPYNPFIEKEFASTKFPNDLAVYKNYLYSAEEYNGIRIYDISLENPIEINSINNEGGLGLGVLVRDDKLYAALGGGLRIYSLDNPANPEKLGSIDTPGARSSRVILDIDKDDSTYVYMSYGYNIEIINITNKSNPFIEAYFKGDPAAASGIDIKGKYIFAAQGFLGLNIFTNDLFTSIDIDRKQELPKDFELYQNYPNPFNTQTKISFSLSKPSKMKLELFNSLGELVLSIFERYLQAGKYELLFNAEGLTSGVYYIILEAEGYRKVVKTILLK